MEHHVVIEKIQRRRRNAPAPGEPPVGRHRREERFPRRAPQAVGQRRPHDVLRTHGDLLGSGSERIAVVVPVGRADQVGKRNHGIAEFPPQRGRYGCAEW